tara:strand:+ start:1213 stop:1371 length:159 start_codon:yes stop_codon:yes gene_type:complete
MAKKIKLCCGGKGCPTIELKNKKEVIIKDDYGNQVIMKIDEAKLITNAIKEL